MFTDCFEISGFPHQAEPSRLILSASTRKTRIGSHRSPSCMTSTAKPGELSRGLQTSIGDGRNHGSKAHYQQRPAERRRPLVHHERPILISTHPVDQNSRVPSPRVFQAHVDDSRGCAVQEARHDPRQRKKSTGPSLHPFSPLSTDQRESASFVSLTSSGSSISTPESRIPSRELSECSVANAYGQLSRVLQDTWCLLLGGWRNRELG